MSLYAANATCQMMCEVAQLASYHGRDPGYFGDYFIPITQGIGLGGLAVGSIISLAQWHFKYFKAPKTQDPLPHAESRSWKKWICGGSSVLKFSALTLSVTTYTVAFLDNVSLLLPGAPPSDYFPLWDIGIIWRNCYEACTS